MTRDDIMRLAFEAADGVLSYDAEGRWILSEQEVIRLVAIVAAAEREACAEIAEKQRFAMHISLTSHPPQNGTAVGIANEIRARGATECEGMRWEHTAIVWTAPQSERDEK